METSRSSNLPILLLILLLAGFTEVYAQPVGPVSLAPQTVAVVRFKTANPPPTSTYYGGMSTEIGRLNGSNGTNSNSNEDIYRTAFSYNLRAGAGRVTFKSCVNKKAHPYLRLSNNR